MDFRLLGPLHIHDGTQPWPVPAAKQRIVLAALLLHDGAIVGVDELMDTIWDAAPPAGALTALRNHVMRLRRVIGPKAAERVHTRAPGYFIDLRDGELDLRTFTQLRDRAMSATRAGRHEQARTDLRHALELWRGEPLIDIPADRLRDRDGRRLAELRLDTLRQRIDSDLLLGEAAQLIAELRDLVREHPLHEGFHAQLMTALYRAGRQSEALDAYQQARRTLIDEIGVEPGQELAALHQRILALDPALSPTPATTTATIVTVATVATPPSAPTTPRLVPAQLPADLIDFTGRDTAVKHLRDALHHATTTNTAVAVITGAGGIGKTTLAVHIAHQISDDYPDGQLYVNLHGSTETPPSPDTIVARLLRDLGTDTTQVPVDAEERDNLYRSILATRRVLLVLDDARDAATVRRLIPGSPHCAVIVTTRNRLPTLPTSGRLNLDTLETEESTALIGRIIGAERSHAEPDAVADVLRACAGLPLAIRIASARLIARPTQTIRSFADRLIDTRARLDQLEADDLGIRATFTISYTRLPDHAHTARAFRLLGLWSGTDISASAASALCGMPLPATDHALGILLDAHLLESPAPGRFRLHDLLHVYARERAQRDEPTEARDGAAHRLLTWYLHTIVNADNMLRPHRAPIDIEPAGDDVQPLVFDDYHAALNWLHSEQGNFVAAVRAAENFGMHRHAWQMAVALGPFHYITKRIDDSLITSEIGLSSARTLGDQAAEGAILHVYGTTLCEARRFHEAIDRFTRALALQRSAGDHVRAPATLNSLAIAYAETGQHDLALGAFDNAREMHAQAGNIQGEGLALINMAETYGRIGEHEQSKRYNERALRLHRAIGDRYCEAICLGNLGETHAKANEHEPALALFDEAIAVHIEAGNHHGQALNLVLRGHSQAALGKRAQAMESWRLAHTIFVELSAPEIDETWALIEAAKAAEWKTTTSS